MYSYRDLIWIKSVKRTKGTGWAYSEYKSGDVFYLNWPEKFGKSGNINLPQIGELILIFQTVNIPRGTYLTHIVTPLSNDIYTDESSSHPYIRLMGVIASTTTMPEIPKPNSLNFNNLGWGDVRKITSVKGITQTEIKDIWNLFGHKDDKIQESFTLITNNQTEDESYFEGLSKEMLAIHKFNERNPNAVKSAKEKALNSQKLYCEVCSFDFSKFYPKLGDGFIECHHRNPIATGGMRETKIEDLALVCSNCHRMLHKKNSDGKFYSIDELKQIVVIN